MTPRRTLQSYSTYTPPLCTLHITISLSEEPGRRSRGAPSRRMTSSTDSPTCGADTTSVGHVQYSQHASVPMTAANTISYLTALLTLATLPRIHAAVHHRLRALPIKLASRLATSTNLPHYGRGRPPGTSVHGVPGTECGSHARNQRLVINVIIARLTILCRLIQQSLCFFADIIPSASRNIGRPPVIIVGHRLP